MAYWEFYDYVCTLYSRRPEKNTDQAIDRSEGLIVADDLCQSEIEAILEREREGGRYYSGCPTTCPDWGKLGGEYLSLIRPRASERIHTMRDGY